jgi:putative holliday junction resolvase
MRYTLAMRYLGIDYGTKKIGLATGSDDMRVAFPHSVVAAGPGALSAIDALCQKEDIEALVVGESRDLSGAPNAVMEDIALFAQDLGELTGLPVHFEREFFTSSLAARQFAPEDKSRKANPTHANLDASAAALILQSFLDKKK